MREMANRAGLLLAGLAAKPGKIPLLTIFAQAVPAMAVSRAVALRLAIALTHPLFPTRRMPFTWLQPPWTGPAGCRSGSRRR